MSSSADVCRILRGAATRDRESVYTMLLDARNRVIGVEEVAKGGITDVTVHPREVFKAAMLTNAAAVIIAHNHPSGEGTPSTQDVDLTRRLIEGGNMLGVPVRDHVIVTDTECTSIRDRHPNMGFQGAFGRRR